MTTSVDEQRGWAIANGVPAAAADESFRAQLAAAPGQAVRSPLLPGDKRLEAMADWMRQRMAPEEIDRRLNAIVAGPDEVTARWTRSRRRSAKRKRGTTSTTGRPAPAPKRAAGPAPEESR